MEGRGIGIERPDGLARDDDEYDAFRKRMMLAYRFRPNPLVRSVSRKFRLDSFLLQNMTQLEKHTHMHAFIHAHTQNNSL